MPTESFLALSGRQFACSLLALLAANLLALPCGILEFQPCLGVFRLFEEFSVRCGWCNFFSIPVSVGEHIGPGASCLDLGSGRQFARA